MDSRFRVFTGVVVIVLAACNAFAQARVRVTQDQTIIWDASFTIMAGTVQAGTELDVVGQRGTFYEVILPFRGTGGRTTGFVSASRVEAIGGSLPPAGQPLPRPTGGSAQSRATTQTRPHSGIRGFADLGFARFMAERSFKAILGQAGAVTYGGGVEYHGSNGAFAQVAVEQVRETGERVFVLGDEVFPLGIPDTITLIPLTFTVGYRFGQRGLVPYLGGGAGAYFFKEASDPAEPEDLDDQFTGYHILGGIESHSSWFGAAFEVEYAFVPDALHGGAAEAFDEHTLDGVRVRVKVLFGR